MTTVAFYDTNILIYMTGSDPARAARSRDIVGAGGVVSVQVRNEFTEWARSDTRYSAKPHHAGHFSRTAKPRSNNGPSPQRGQRAQTPETIGLGVVMPGLCANRCGTARARMPRPDRRPPATDVRSTRRSTLTRATGKIVGPGMGHKQNDRLERL